MSRLSFDGACERTRERVDAYLDRELVGANRQAVRLHLEACSCCAADARERIALKARVRGAVREHTPAPELEARVRAQLQAHQAPPWWNLAEWTAPKWAMTVTMLIVASVVAWIWTPRDPLPALDDLPAQDAYIQRVSTGLAGVLRPGLADHIHCAIFRKLPADPAPPAAMEAELGAYSDLLAAVNTAIPKSWHVVMAHQCSYLGRQYVHVILSDGSQPVSLVIARKQDGESFEGMRPSITAGAVPVFQDETSMYRVIGFETRGYLTFLVSGPENTQTLGTVAKLVPGVAAVLARIL
jgi:predicted anti-sigma-YlaC factor YlaD